MITIKGIYGREMFETWYAMNAMVSTGPATSLPVITDRFPAGPLGGRLRRWPAGATAARSSSTGR